ncbi:MAG: hypothetical protein PHQ12_03170 [Chthoniobacteraceae bacterium]|nr:hypothetical protein [Chthoniobacteraceae bacterium]
MKIKTLLLTVLLSVFCGMLLPRQAEASVTFSYFYESLAPFGDWVDVDQYGYCWQPRGVEPDWRPYTDGYWSYTDAGWTWVSYEDFGAITYHYGRWVRLDDVGWVWRPDYQWGPAWVSWRQSDDYVGWAPLPPDAEFDADTGIGVWVDRDYDIGPSAYVFCENRYFGAPVLRNYVLPWRRNIAIINSTVNITNITVITGGDHGRIIFNGGLDYRRISSRGDFRIEMLHLRREREGDWLRHPRPEFARKVGGELLIIAPEIEAPKTRFAPAIVARAIHTPHVDKGWSGITDPRDRERVKARYSEETKGLTRATAPAKPVAAAQVQTMMREVQSQPQKPLATQGRHPGAPQATPQAAPQIAPQAAPSAALQQNGVQPAASGTPQAQPRRFQRDAQPQVTPSQKTADPAATATPQAQPRRFQRDAQPQATPSQKTADPAATATPQAQPRRLQRDAQPQATPQPKAADPARTMQEQGRQYQRDAQQQATQVRKAPEPAAARTPQEQPQRLQRESRDAQPQAQPQRFQRESRDSSREAATPRAPEPSRERPQPQVQRERPQPQAQRPAPAQQSPTPSDERKHKFPGQD